MPRSIRILLVEDNPGDVYLMRRTLEEACCDLDITVVRDGAEAVRYLLKDHAPAEDHDRPPPDLVLLDLNLPKLSGHDVLVAARKREDLRALPIVVVTSSSAPADIAASYACGANCYVTKPGELTSFQSAIRAVGSFWCGIASLPPAQAGTTG
jgi:two-component system, chemotaxis family, response regulator Rcp1